MGGEGRRRIKQNYAVAFCSFFLHGDLALGIETKRGNNVNTSLHHHTRWEPFEGRTPFSFLLRPLVDKLHAFYRKLEKVPVHLLFFNCGLKKEIFFFF